MDFKKSLLEVNNIYKPLIPLGIILIFVNLDGSLLIYITAVASIFVGFLGFFVKNRFTKFIAGALFATTGSYMVLSLFDFYITLFGIFMVLFIVLFALLIIIEGIFAMYSAIKGERIYKYPEVYDEEYYTEYGEEYTED